MTHRVRLAVILYSAAVGVYLLDRLTKYLAVEFLAGKPAVDLIPRVVRLRYTTNAGGAFGLFGGQPWLFFAATLVVCAAIAVASTRLSSGASSLGLGLILGGALGNLTDRVIRGPGVSGQVVDFIDFHVWPVFNLADSAIVVGAVIILLAGLRRPSDGKSP
ncbi:MAG TPA: signal peptidase II [Actinomycetota bacterium]|nr:signal peptidase II [Actinomycetota bacterium]